ncbi:MAG: helix-turn-helix transcriptional regulator [Spirochaetales bacterium]|nr:helix-turn-helix transcriptional regulator [Spirochaetales bacterium]MBP7264905.1 helix-turn-helix transcriptional regulator [Spirochaetia bacterium]
MTNRVREFRKERGLTQQELADAVGTTRQTVISVETGKYKPSVELALKMARALTARVEDLFLLEADHEA